MAAPSNFFDFTRNFSFYTVPVAWVIALAPHAYAQQLAAHRFDNRHPRDLVSSLKEDQSLDHATKAKIKRAEGAQNNGFENLGLFAAAVVAGNLAGLDNRLLNYLSGGYLVSRLAYTWVYINNESQALASARSTLYVGGVGLIMTLFTLAGNKMRNVVLQNVL